MNGSTPWLPSGFEFLSGLPLKSRLQRVLLPIQIFIDDSGGKGQTASFVLAGWISTAERWAAFSDAWDACLKRPPALKRLKMHDAGSCAGAFAGFSKTQRDEKLRELAKTIAYPEFTALHCTTDLSGFAETFGKQPKPFKDPYFWAFHTMIMSACMHLVEAGHQERFEIVFDEHVIFGPRAKRWYPLIRHMMSDPEEQQIIPIEPMFRSDDEFLPLQAADMIAWLIRRTMDGQENEFSWLAKEDLLAKATMSPSSQFYTRERMLRIMETMRQIYEEGKFDEELTRIYKEVVGP